MPASVEKITRRKTLPLEFARPAKGLVFKQPASKVGMFLSGRPAWQSNGGVRRGHPARSLPFSLEASVPEKVGPISAITLVGIFALYADAESEPVGSYGAALELLSEGKLIFRKELQKGKHYFVANEPWPELPSGDLVEYSTIGTVKHPELGHCLVKALRFQLEEPIVVDQFKFRDLGTASSFVIFDVLLHRHGVALPAGSRSEEDLLFTQVMLQIRIGEYRSAFESGSKLIEMLAQQQPNPVERNRLLKMATAGFLSCAAARLGIGRTACLLEQASRTTDPKQTAYGILREVTRIDLSDPQSISERVTAIAFEKIEKGFAQDLRDVDVAASAGISPSYFRQIFRSETGVPFQRYLSNYRLERAFVMLQHETVPVKSVAEAVGFRGVAQFSRAFSAKYGIAPSQVRKGSKTVPSQLPAVLGR